MTLDTIDWDKITCKQAGRLRAAASKREQAMTEKFRRDEVTEGEFLAAITLTENLHVFQLTGLKPGEH